MMLIKYRIYSQIFLGFTLQPLIFHEMDMTPWVIFPSKKWQRQTHSTFLVAVFAHSFSEILTKHYIIKNSSKGNIWGPFYLPKGEGSDGG